MAKSSELGAAEKAEIILQSMIERQKIGKKDITPNTISFNNVINAWDCSGDEKASSQAERILLHVEELHASGNNNVQ